MLLRGEDDHQIRAYMRVPYWMIRTNSAFRASCMTERSELDSIDYRPVIACSFFIMYKKVWFLSTFFSSFIIRGKGLILDSFFFFVFLVVAYLEFWVLATGPLSNFEIKGDLGIVNSGLLYVGSFIWSGEGRGGEINYFLGFVFVLDWERGRELWIFVEFECRIKLDAEFVDIDMSISDGSFTLWYCICFFWRMI